MSLAHKFDEKRLHLPYCCLSWLLEAVPTCRKIDIPSFICSQASRESVWPIVLVLLRLLHFKMHKEEVALCEKAGAPLLADGLELISLLARTAVRLKQARSAECSHCWAGTALLLVTQSFHFGL